MSERDFSAQTAAAAGQQRVVVTGVGAVTPLGTDAPATWTSLLEGRCGIGPIGAFDASGFSTRIAAEVRGFDPQAACDLSPKDARRLDRFVLLGLAAAREAVADAGLPLPLPDGDRCGVYVGSGMGGLVTLSEQFDVLRRRGPDRVSPFLVPMMICDMASGQISISLGARGPNMAIVSACATGAHAIGEAAAAIRAGRADVILAGGAEAVITAIGIAGFAAARALSTRNDEPQRASRPFDRERDGFVMGEGAAVVVLEREDLARRARRRIYAEVAGYGASADAYHLTAPPESGEGAVRCMRQALAGAGLDPSDAGLPQRPRHQHPAERPRRDGGDQDRLRRRRRTAGDQLDQGGDGPPARSRRQRRGRGGDQSHRVRRRASHPELRDPRSGL